MILKPTSADLFCAPPCQASVFREIEDVPCTTLAYGPAGGEGAPDIQGLGSFSVAVNNPVGEREVGDVACNMHVNGAAVLALRNSLCLRRFETG